MGTIGDYAKGGGAMPGSSGYKGGSSTEKGTISGSGSVGGGGGGGVSGTTLSQQQQSQSNTPRQGETISSYLDRTGQTISEAMQSVSRTRRGQLSQTVQPKPNEKISEYLKRTGQTPEQAMRTLSGQKQRTLREQQLANKHPGGRLYDKSKPVPQKEWEQEVSRRRSYEESQKQVGIGIKKGVVSDASPGYEGLIGQRMDITTAKQITKQRLPVSERKKLAEKYTYQDPIQSGAKTIDISKVGTFNYKDSISGDMIPLVGANLPSGSNFIIDAKRKAEQSDAVRIAKRKETIQSQFDVLTPTGQTAYLAGLSDIQKTEEVLRKETEAFNLKWYGDVDRKSSGFVTDTFYGTKRLTSREDEKQEKELSKQYEDYNKKLYGGDIGYGEISPSEYKKQQYDKRIREGQINFAGYLERKAPTQATEWKDKARAITADEKDFSIKERALLPLTIIGSVAGKGVEFASEQFIYGGRELEKLDKPIISDIGTATKNIAERTRREGVTTAGVIGTIYLASFVLPTATATATTIWPSIATTTGVKGLAIKGSLLFAEGALLTGEAKLVKNIAKSLSPQQDYLSEAELTIAKQSGDMPRTTREMLWEKGLRGQELADVSGDIYTGRTREGLGMFFNLVNIERSTELWGQMATSNIKKASILSIPAKEGKFLRTINPLNLNFLKYPIGRRISSAGFMEGFVGSGVVYDYTGKDLPLWKQTLYGVSGSYFAGKVGLGYVRGAVGKGTLTKGKTTLGLGYIADREEILGDILAKNIMWGGKVTSGAPPSKVTTFTSAFSFSNGGTTSFSTGVKSPIKVTTPTTSIVPTSSFITTPTTTAVSQPTFAVSSLVSAPTTAPVPATIPDFVPTTIPNFVPVEVPTTSTVPTTTTVPTTVPTFNWGVPFFMLPGAGWGSGLRKRKAKPKRKYTYTPDIMAIILGQKATKKPVTFGGLYTGQERRKIINPFYVKPKPKRKKKRTKK